MDLAAVMDEIANRIRDSDDPDTPGPDAIMDDAKGWPASTISPPCFIVGYPPNIALDVTGRDPDGRSSSRMLFPCWAVFGIADLQSSRDVMSSFLGGLKARLDGPAPGVWQSAWAQGITLETLSQDDGTEYLAARFDVDVLT